MTRRPVGSDDDPHRKRRKTTKTTETATPAEREKHEITSSRDLQWLLAFDHDVGPVPRQSKIYPQPFFWEQEKERELEIEIEEEKRGGPDFDVGIQSLRAFLASIAFAAESDDRFAKRALLLDYLRSQAPHNGNDASPYLGNIIQTWHFAARTNADGLFASVIAVLALLLNSISSLVDFREYGNRLCTTILHDDQIKLIDKALGTHGAKDYLVSPCLQLLTEVVAFDGGYAARTVYRQREITFKRLDVFLGMRKGIYGDNVKAPKSRTIRENAVGYLLANLRLQNSAAKMTIIAQGKILRALLDGIAEDPSSIVLDVLEVLRRDIATDGAISHTAKGRVFNHWTLSRLASLYGYNESSSFPDGHQDVQASVHGFLLLLCTSLGCGLLEIRNESHVGGHAVTTNKVLENLPEEDGINELDNDDGERRVERNPRLQMFLQSLRPYANVLQRDLILAVFQKSPELMPDYFSSGKSFAYELKLTTTWIGYASFLLGAVAIPLPDFITSLSANGANGPLYGKIMDSVLPKPCTQRVMTRCLNQSVNLVKFFTLQILNAAFEKFAAVLQRCEEIQRYTDDQRNRLAWCRIVSVLRDDFCRRVPELKHVIAQFRHSDKDSTMLRENATRLIALYYKTLPQVALEEKFDISVTISTALVDVQSSWENHEDSGMRSLELEHLIEIAHRSPNMQWWHKPDSMCLSPFTLLLRFYLYRKRIDATSEQIRTVLNAVITENQILRSNASMASLNTLVLSLQDSEDWKASSGVFEFLDHCVLCLVRKLVHYYDILANLIAAAELDINPVFCQIDLLLITIMEQWRFLVDRADAPTVANVSEWLIRFIEVTKCRNSSVRSLPLRDETTKLLSQIRDQLKSEVQDTTCRAIFEKTLEKRPELEGWNNLVAASAIIEAKDMSKPADPPLRMHSLLPETSLPPGLAEEHKDHPGLHQWTRYEVQDAISEGHIKALILCLCSKQVGVRKQALTGLRTFMMKLELSEYSEWQQTYMLVGELVETAAKIVSDDPLPFYAGVLAAGLLLVLADPLHLLYAKVNDFLNRGPEWTVTKLPSYWVDRILLKPPTSDDGHHQEAEWLLEGLIDGLRTSADLDIYRKCHIFERLLSFSASRSLPERCSEKMLDLLFRCTYVTGSSTLITRCGLMSWISSRLASHAMDDLTKERLKSLASRAYETSDLERVDSWTNGTLKYTLDGLQTTQRR